MNLEQIIARQEKEFKKRFVIKCSDGELMADFKDGKILKPKQILDFHRSSIKEILEGLKQREQEMLDKTIELQNTKDNEVWRLSVENSIIAKRDTINHLEEIIKKL